MNTYYPQSTTEKQKMRKAFLSGLGVSLVILVAFFAGAIADRLFVIRPLDLLKQKSNSVSFLNSSGSSSRGDLIPGSSLPSLWVADVAEESALSVVTVTLKKQQRFLETQPDAKSFFGIFDSSNTTVRIEEIKKDIGTGFVIEGGFVVTNKHVVTDTTANYEVIDNNDNEYQVTKIYRDPEIDLAILQVENLDLEPMPLGDSDLLRVGEPVVAIGTALGEFRHTVTLGVISGLGRGISATDGLTGFSQLDGVIQTDAAINPGNSGGPLINSAGTVIGVNVATANAENISFAIPINLIKNSLENFNQTGQFERPVFGVKYRFIDQQIAVANEVSVGALLVEVSQQGVAGKAGLKTGDIIFEFNGEEIDEENKLARLTNNQKLNSKVKIKIWREGQIVTLEVTFDPPTQL